MTPKRRNLASHWRQAYAVTPDSTGISGFASGRLIALLHQIAMHGEDEGGGLFSFTFELDFPANNSKPLASNL